MAIQNVNPQTALEMAKSGTLFIDVREKGETDCTRYGLDNVTYLPLSEFEKKAMTIIPQDKNTKIILACQAGGRSMMAAGFLERNGYQNLFNLAGGYSMWSAQGLPTNEGAAATTDCCSKPGCC